jgi:glycosyltransferase involved in cell wall biosynthesis
MTDTPAVSVLVTVYNRESYLEQTLRSILASTFTDFEVIVVDDCSTDASAAIAKKLAEEDNRILFIQNEANLGDYGNRMKVASLARGPLLKYVDSDDLIYPYTLQVMVDAMNQHPEAAVGLAHSMPEDDQPYPWLLSSELAYEKHFLKRGCMSCGPTGAIIRRDAFNGSGGFRKEWGVLSDSDLWYRIAAEHSILLLPPGLVWWRRHEGQEYTKDGAAMDYLCRGYELDVLHLFADACPLPEQKQKVAIAKKRQHMARRLFALATKGRSPRLAMRLRRQIKLSWGEMAAGVRGYQS